MIDIRVYNQDSPELIDPCDVFNTEYGKIFQQYKDGIPCKDYYISCGPGAQSVVHLWFDTEDNVYKLSTDDKKSLRGLVKSIKVLEIRASITIDLSLAGNFHD